MSGCRGRSEAVYIHGKPEIEDKQLCLDAVSLRIHFRFTRKLYRNCTEVCFAVKKVLAILFGLLPLYFSLRFDIITMVSRLLHSPGSCRRSEIT